MDIKIIGLVGLKRSGKDTVADYLCEYYNFEKYSFADPLKKGCASMFGLTFEQLNTDLKDVVDPMWGCTPRDILKVMGTEICQFELSNHIDSFKPIGRNIWVKLFEKWYQQEALNKKLNVVISDLRFIHEYEKITSMGGKIWRIERPGKNVGDMHSSEKELFEIPCDNIIINDGSLDDLYIKIEEILNK